MKNHIICLLFLFLSLEAMDQHHYDPTMSLFLYMQSTNQPFLKKVQEYVYIGAKTNGSFQGTPLLEQLIHKAPYCDSIADEKEYLAILDFYLQQGAEPNMRNSALKCPLQWIDALHTNIPHRHKNSIELLCRYGANPALKNREGETAFFGQSNTGFFGHKGLYISNMDKIKESNAQDKMRYYLLYGHYKDLCSSAEYVKKIKRFMVSPSFHTFLCVLHRKRKENSCYQLPKELIKQIMVYSHHEIDYQKMVEKKLLTLPLEKVPALIEECPQWTRQSIKSLRLVAPQRAQSITDLLHTHYVQEGKKVLAVKNKLGMMAKDGTTYNLSLRLDPEKFEENFKDTIREIINEE